MTFTTEEQGFISTILANPDDVAPRLIYADWLDENGKTERAAFIRSAINDATWPREKATLRWDRIRYGRWQWCRERLHLSTRRIVWDPDLRFAPDICAHIEQARALFPEAWRLNLNTVIYRNGFVDELGVDRFHSNTFRLMEVQPVRTVTTTAEALLQVVDLFPARLPLRTIRLTTVPSNVIMMADGSLRMLRYSDVPKVIYIPNRPSDVVIAPAASLVKFYLKRIAEHYLAPRGITVEFPASD